MSEYFFGQGRGHIPAKTSKVAERIAKKHGAYLVEVDLPGDGPRYWFATQNNGHPFDQQTERAVISGLTAVGLEITALNKTEKG